MAEAAKKLNRADNLPYITVYYAGSRKLRIPTTRKHGLRGENERGLTGFELFQLSLITAFSSPEENGKQCAFRFEDFEEIQAAGSATVNRGIKNLCAGGLIEQDKSDHAQTKYRVKVDLDKSKYIYIDTEIVRHRGITVNGNFYHLSRHEILVYCFILTNCLNEENEGVFRAAYNKIANALGISSSSAGKCIRKLTKIKAIECTVTGVNSDVESEYKVNPGLLLTESNKRTKWEEERKEREAKRESRKPKFRREIEARDAQAQREKEYAERQEKAIRHANFFRAKAMQDKEYSRLETEIRALDMEIAKAEVYQPDKVAELTQKYNELVKAQDKRLSKLSITRQMLEPQFQCPKCSDSGWLPDGRECNCYKPPRWRR